MALFGDSKAFSQLDKLFDESDAGVLVVVLGDGLSQLNWNLSSADGVLALMAPLGDEMGEPSQLFLKGSAVVLVVEVMSADVFSQLLANWPIMSSDPEETGVPA